MAMLYDETKHDEAVARRGALEANLEELALRMHDEREGKDGDWDTARLNAYMVQEAEHARLSRDLQAVDREIDRWETIRPRPVAEQRDPSVLERFMREGISGLGEDEVRFHEAELERHGFPVSRGDNRGIVVRMVTTSDSTSGENAVDTETQPRIVSRLLNFGGARQVAQLWATERGNPIKVPQIDATAQTGTIISAQAASVGNPLDLPDIGETEFGAYTYTSRPIRVSNEAIQDIAFDIGGFIENESVRRLGRVTNQDFTNGDGTGNPQGFVPLATTTTTAAAAAAVTWQELLDLQYDVDDAYLDGGEMGPGGKMSEMGQGLVGYTMSRKMEQLIRKLSDGENRPLWLPAIAAGMPNMIHGYPYVLNYAMDNPTTGKKPIVFGNFHYFIVRSVQTVAVYDFWDSRTAQTNTREVLAFCRDDSDAIAPRVSGECPAFAALTMA